MEDDIHRLGAHHAAVDVDGGQARIADGGVDVVIVAHDGDVVRNGITRRLELVHELVGGLVAVADERGGHVVREGELREDVALVAAVADDPVLPEGDTVLEQRLVVAEVPVLDGACGAYAPEESDAAVSVLDEVAGEHVGAVETVGEHGIHVLAAAVEIQEHRRQLEAHKAVDVVLGKLTQHDEPVHLVVEHGVRHILDCGGVVSGLIRHHLEHAVVVLILEELHDIAVNYPVERAGVADEVLRDNYADVVGEPVLDAVGAGVDAVAHLGRFLLYPLAELRAHSVAVSERLGNGHGADAHDLGDIAHCNSFFGHFQILSGTMNKLSI